MELTCDNYIFLSGDQQYNFLVSEKSKLPLVTQVTQIENTRCIKKIVFGQKKHLLVLKTKNKLELYSAKPNTEDFEVTNYELKNEQIVDIVSGSKNYLVLTQKGKVYGLGQPYETTRNSLTYRDFTFKTLKKVEFFDKGGLSVKSVIMSHSTMYYLCTNKKLYGVGYNYEGQLGNGTKEDSDLPIVIHENVGKAFSSESGSALFFVTNSNQLYCCGYNNCGCLGVGNNDNKYNPQEIEIKNVRPLDILDLQTGICHTVFITTKGQTYSCGHLLRNGHNKRKITYAFTQILALKDEIAKQISVGALHTLLLTANNQLFGWGFQGEISPFPNSRNYAPQKIRLPYLKNYSFKNLNLKIYSGNQSSFIYISAQDQSIFQQDFQNLFQNKSQTSNCLLYSNTKPKDLFKNENYLDQSEKSVTIKKKMEKENTDNSIPIPAHKLLIELRTGLKIREIQNIINVNNFSKREIDIFLKWAYFDQIRNEKVIKRFFNSFNFPYPPKHSIDQDVLKLYNHEDTKDFFILSKQEEGEEEEEEEEQAFPIHKFILIARSGLFREMFHNLNEKEKNINQITDFSKKSQESLKIFIKYLYTNKIQLDADDNPELIFEELEDAVEYYQLNENCNFNEQLINIKK
ncbi:btk-binding protein-related [Anaeramoeba flamelloides]|uniref:Btk-binding protein-related n=1 Tax=Anaeramoeba flamelloides TaxID=1746091 RepID=A0AAV7ZUY3_9EUKA|nr:btk-binding protein-related [Anaeramoeba flamelloides]